MEPGMDLLQIKYHTCPSDLEQGVLLVDLETETKLNTDTGGNKQYYCLAGKHIFSVEANEEKTSYT